MNTPWQLIFLLALIPGYIIAPILLKKLVNLPGKVQRQCWMYFYCFLLSLAFLLFTKDNIINPFTLIIIGIGIVNSLAVLCFWRAVAISLSKTAIFTQADDLVAITLGYIFLNELQFINLTLLIGILLTFTAVFLFTRYGQKSGNKTPKLLRNKTLIGWVAGYSFIWGSVAFLMRYFALEGVSFTKFLFGWYSGSLLGSFLLTILLNRKRKRAKLQKKQIISVFPLAFFVWLSMVLSYWLFNLAPITVIQPISMASEMIIPCLIGLFIFKESKKLSTIELIALLIGLAGGLIIAFSF